jgi:hypothetical protein
LEWTRVFDKAGVSVGLPVGYHTIFLQLPVALAMFFGIKMMFTFPVEQRSTVAF